MKAFYILSLAVSAAIVAPSNSPNGLDPRACCTVKICDGFKLGGKCYTGCYPKIDEVILDPGPGRSIVVSWKYAGFKYSLPYILLSTYADLWESQYKASWVLVDICMSLAMLGMELASIALQANVMDAYPDHVSSVLPAIQLLPTFLPQELPDLHRRAIHHPIHEALTYHLPAAAVLIVVVVAVTTTTITIKFDRTEAARS
ncbi:hypothetical protein PG994_008528 [Apiospora phragmitis]|uniref:Uncharacterized protein n=1 Tax=Apiospora phragmitis TaxID=2905665 RepID=A0ABR1UGQ4_9PEZI